jgi:hypothetical protein
VSVVPASTGEETSCGTVREQIRVLPGELLPGDELRDHGTVRTVARVEPAAVLSETFIVIFEPDQYGDTLGVTARVPVTAWRETA